MVDVTTIQQFSIAFVKTGLGGKMNNLLPIKLHLRPAASKVQSNYAPVTMCPSLLWYVVLHCAKYSKPSACKTSQPL